MATTKFTSHTRSISLPTSSHPLLATAEDHLQRLRSSDGTSSSLSSHTSTCQKLDGLRNLYECLDDLLQLPISHQQLTRERNGTWEDEILDASIRLLDICSTTREVYSMVKESVHELESSLRRKGSRDIDSKIDAYMTSKRKLNKMICKCYKEIKRSEKICSVPTVNNVSVMTLPLITLIKEVQEISLTTLKSSLSLISGPMSQSGGAWTLVSKLFQSKEDQSDTSEIQKFELMLLSINNSKCNKDHLKQQLGAMDSNIQEVAELLEATFRIFLKARTSLLNILNH